ncbi:hypothetical protein [Streptomyces sp. NPDC004376]
MMVATGCLGTVLRCRSAPGLCAAVQPCTTDRRASGGAVLLGPITTATDAETVCAWLGAGMPDDGTLPQRLRAEPVPPRDAPLD